MAHETRLGIVLDSTLASAVAKMSTVPSVVYDLSSYKNDWFFCTVVLVIELIIVYYLGVLVWKRYPRDDWIKESLDDIGWINPCSVPVMINRDLNWRGSCWEMAMGILEPNAPT